MTDYSQKDPYDVEYESKQDDYKSKDEYLEEKLSPINHELFRIRCKLFIANMMLFLFTAVIAFMLLAYFNVIGIHGSRRVLMVDFVSQDYSESVSDRFQVDNALEKGGCILVKTDTDGLQTAFGEEYKQYGAVDYSGRFYTLGAAINYISSRGWTFVQGPSSGLSNTYYFEK